MIHDFEKFRQAVSAGEIRLRADSAKVLRLVLFSGEFGGTRLRSTTRALFWLMGVLTAAGYATWGYLLFAGHLVSMALAFVFAVIFWKNLLMLATGFVRDIALREDGFLNAALDAGILETESASPPPGVARSGEESPREKSPNDEPYSAEIKAIEEALASRPADGKLLYDLAVTCLTKGDMDRALDAYNRLSLVDDRLAGKLHDLIVRVGP